MYNVMLSLHNNGKYVSKWTNNIKRILDSCRMSHVWMNQEGDNIKWLKDRRLKDQFIQKWSQELKDMLSCQLYIELKKELKFEKYFVCLPMQNRIELCKCRINNSRLPVVVGRY